MKPIYNPNTLKGGPSCWFAYNGSSMSLHRWTKSAYVEAAEWHSFSPEHVRMILASPSYILSKLVLTYQGEEENYKNKNIFPVYDIEEENFIDWEEVKKYADYKTARTKEINRLKRFINNNQLSVFSSNEDRLIAEFYYSGRRFVEVLPLHFTDLTLALEIVKTRLGADHVLKV